MHIAASGYYGMGNFGDDLFLHTFRQLFHGHHVYPWQAKLDPDQADAVIIGGGDLITPYSFNRYYFPSPCKDGRRGCTALASSTLIPSIPGPSVRWPLTGNIYPRLNEPSSGIHSQPISPPGRSCTSSRR